jgi:hypothetical protein
LREKPQINFSYEPATNAIILRRYLVEVSEQLWPVGDERVLEIIFPICPSYVVKILHVPLEKKVIDRLTLYHTLCMVQVGVSNDYNGHENIELR